MATSIKVSDIKGTDIKGINFEAFGGFQGFLDATSSGGSATGWRAQQLRRVVPWLAKATDMTANAIASLPFDIVNDSGDVVDTSSDWKNKFGGLPAPEVLLFKVAASLCLGQAYVYPTYTNRLVVSMQYFAPQTITPNIDINGLQWFDRASERGKVERYYPVNKETDPPLLYFWLPDPDVELGPALSYPAGAALLSSKLLFSFDDTIQTYSERGFVPATLLSAKGMPGPAEREKAEAWWNRFLRGWTKEAAKIVNADAMTVNRIGSGMDELKGAYAEMTKQAIENIGTAFGIPAALFMSDMAYATEMNAMIKMWYTTSAFVKIYKTIENTFTDQLLSMYGLKWVFRPETIDAFKDDEVANANAYKVYVDAGILPSIASKIVGLELPEGVTPEMLDAQVERKQQQEDEQARINNEMALAKLNAGNKPDEQPVKGWVTINGNHVLIGEEGDDIYTQKEPGGRAAGGGVTTGINQQQYLGGQFLPQSEIARAEKLERDRQAKENQYMAKKQEIAPYVFQTPPTPDSSAIFPQISGTMPYNKETQQFDDSNISQATREYIGNRISFVPKYNAGERWYINPNLPHLKPQSGKSLTLTADEIEELALWRQIAERKDRKGKGRVIDFKCKYLSDEVADEIRAKLQSGCDIAKAFEIGNSEIQKSQPIDNDGLKMLAEAINKATEKAVIIDNKEQK